MKKYIPILFILIASVSCSEYQRLLKSNDNELKYEKAVTYFEKKDYMRAATLFDEVSRYFKGTDRSEQVLNYLALSYTGQKDYYTAIDYYKVYVRTYPKGQFIQEARFNIGHCYYLISPEARLDQEDTHNAINALQEFIDIHPNSDKVPEANKLLDDLKDKLSYKELLNARLYYNLGSYLGNNFLAAIIVSQNALKNYPSNLYRDDFSFTILQAKYQQAVMSVEEKKEERYRDTIDEYYNYVNEFPEGKHVKDAKKIYADAKRIVKD